MLIIMLFLYAGITVYQSATRLFGQGGGPIFFSDLRCSGNEKSLLECPRNVFIGSRCTHSRDVGVQCLREHAHFYIIIYIIA